MSTTAGGVTTSYSYDALDRLTSIASGGNTIGSYTYNGDGLRVAKAVGGVTTNFTWDPSGIGTVLADGNEYIWGLGLIGRIEAGDVRTQAHQDGLRTTRLITDATGTVVGTTEHDAFGSTRSSTGLQYRLGFAGEQFDAETGLIYLRARNLDPSQGRFLTKDPLGLAGGSINLYTYVNNNPVNLVDPTGKMLPAVVVLGLGGILGGIGSMANVYFSNQDAGVGDYVAAFIAGFIGGLVQVGITFAFPGVGAIIGGIVGGALASIVASFFNYTGLQDMISDAATSGIIGGMCGVGGGTVGAKNPQVDWMLMREWYFSMKQWKMRDWVYIADQLTTAATSMFGEAVIQALFDLVDTLFGSNDSHYPLGPPVDGGGGGGRWL